MTEKRLVLGIKCEPGAVLPERTDGNAGVDLRVLTGDLSPITLSPGESHVFHTGIKLDIPEGYYVEIVPRSSVGIKKHLRLMNTKAVIDSSYKGEILIALHNYSSTSCVEIENNERVCQMILNRVEDYNIIETNDVGISNRGENGIGSTGRM